MCWLHYMSCFEMSIVESLAIAVMPGMSMPHLASAYPQGLVTSSVGDNVITITDTPYYDPVVSCGILGWEFPVLCHSKQCLISVNHWWSRSWSQIQSTIWRRIFSTLSVSLTVVGMQPSENSFSEESKAPSPKPSHYCTPHQPRVFWPTTKTSGRGAHRRWPWGSGAYPAPYPNFGQMLSHPYGIWMDIDYDHIEYLWIFIFRVFLHFSTTTRRTKNNGTSPLMKDCLDVASNPRFVALRNTRRNSSAFCALEST